MRNVYYHKLIIGNEVGFPLKTLSPDLTVEQAAVIITKTSGLDRAAFHGKTMSLLQVPDDGREARCLRDATVIDILPDGVRFFRRPGHTVNVTVTRIDRNGSQGTLTDILSVPSFLVNSDCTGKAVKRLFRQIAEDFVDTYGEAQDVFPFFKDGVLDWNSFFKLPSEWLAGYGVTITPIDTYLSLDAGMDENLPPMED